MSHPIRQAVVLAGGKGTRLGGLTSETPKPLLPVGGRPFIEWVIANLARHGVSDVIVTTGYRAEAFAEWLGSFTGPTNVSLFVEDIPLDTGGALCLIADRLDEALFVLNGDTLFDVPMGVLGASLLDSEVDAVIALRPVEDVSRYGRVGLRKKIVTSFAEKSGPGAGLINGGLYAFRRRALEGRRSPMSIERDLVPELVRGGRVRGLECDGFFIDIGVPTAYSEAQWSVPKRWEGISSGGLE